MIPKKIILNSCGTIREFVEIIIDAKAKEKKFRYKILNSKSSETIIDYSEKDIELMGKIFYIEFIY